MSSFVNKAKVVFVLGGPGAGKGTQCAKIADRFRFTHLSAGELLRAERSRGPYSQYGTMIEQHMREGKIVPVEVTCSLLERAMKSSSGQRLFLIDGFPRNQDNLDGWNRRMSAKVDMQFVLFFDCHEDVCVHRCLKRGHNGGSGGGGGCIGSGRSDDNLATLRKRIQTYNENSMPIIKYFEGAGQVKKIDAAPNVEQVFTQVERTFLASGF
ncbi:UMP-CMP kinase-like [Drosophila obscura]|uniref:UMP-CMP kinase-like n=1 Tax=Drosophila obscura TaxID=7282 RepID=UPI001BB160B4|nr:UMP-CMP kinase-like [Drosophila obscura]